MAASADQILTVLSGLIGYGGKWAQDWWTAKKAQKKEDEALWSLHKQQFHPPCWMLDDSWRPGSPSRRDDEVVQRLRKRMCYELTLATSSLYWTARYLLPPPGWYIFTSAAVGRA
jgi:hypothetical protein